MSRNLTPSLSVAQGGYADKLSGFSLPPGVWAAIATAQLEPLLNAAAGCAGALPVTGACCLTTEFPGPPRAHQVLRVLGLWPAAPCMDLRGRKGCVFGRSLLKPPGPRFCELQKCSAAPANPILFPRLDWQVSTSPCCHVNLYCTRATVNSGFCFSQELEGCKRDFSLHSSCKAARLSRAGKSVITHHAKLGGYQGNWMLQP